VCERWLNDFDAFCKDVGEKPEGKELDRIDNNKNYEPGNLRWTTRKVNQRNQRRSRFIAYYDGKRALADICKSTGIDYFCLYGALRRGNESAINYIRNKGLENIVLAGVPVWDNERPAE
jgi:hypothetical protein